MHTISSQKELTWRKFSPGPIQPLQYWKGAASVAMLRLDLLQSWASGNKYYKLKYALQYALAHDFRIVVSKGGMFSNHLAALAEACAFFDLHLVSVIRSHVPDENNPSIQRLRAYGSEILYVRPDAYASFDDADAERLYPGALFIPEGGLSALGIKGTAEIMAEINALHPSHIILAGGTMGTACGIISSVPPSVKVIIVPAWKGCTDSYFYEILRKYYITPSCSWELWPDYHFGGFGRFNQQLINFMSSFATTTGIPLDPVYTGKLMYALDDKMKSGYFKETDSVVVIHTGGLQGLEGYRYRFPTDWILSIEG